MFAKTWVFRVKSLDNFVEKIELPYFKCYNRILEKILMLFVISLGIFLI